MDREKLIEAMARALSEDGFAADWPHGIRSAQAALEAHDALMEQAGYVSVPAEPTSQMSFAGEDSYGDKFYFKAQDAERCYTRWAFIRKELSDE